MFYHCGLTEWIQLDRSLLFLLGLVVNQSEITAISAFILSAL
ncbi:hypothetical protein RBSWK_01437 [Rhodopirellula baltica SWK14]|uniref:Uncharacterized protein n=1 Tax=Rhodopirellula baltica SWK14 TaxID=993516 RepID=L7CLC0_RHOBT|nr:hypothetical protein RBSWK_01437 [Rhodopirellula baltica SWK14]